MPKSLLSFLVAMMVILGSYSRDLQASKLVNHVSQHHYSHIHDHFHNHHHAKDSSSEDQKEHSHNLELSFLTLPLVIPASPSLLVQSISEGYDTTLFLIHPSLNGSDYPTYVFRPPIV